METPYVLTVSTDDEPHKTWEVHLWDKAAEKAARQYVRHSGYGARIRDIKQGNA